MRQGQEGYHGIVLRRAMLAQLHDDAAHGGHHVLMCQHDALGHARGPRSVADCADALGRWWLRERGDRHHTDYKICDPNLRAFWLRQKGMVI